MPLDPTEKSATVVIRAALYARRSDLVGIARDTGVSAESFHAFLGGSRLAPDVLAKLTARICHGLGPGSTQSPWQRARTRVKRWSALRPPSVLFVPRKTEGALAFGNGQAYRKGLPRTMPSNTSRADGIKRGNDGGRLRRQPPPPPRSGPIVARSDPSAGSPTSSQSYRSCSSPPKTCDRAPSSLSEQKVSFRFHPLPAFLRSGSGLRNGRALGPVYLGCPYRGQDDSAFPCPPSCSFDHLVGAGEERGRDGKAESPCRFQVNDQFKSGRLLDRTL